MEKQEKQKIDESMNLQEQWYKDANAQTLETLPAFLNHLLNDYEHDYGTIVHAITAGAIATVWAMNRTENGGISGFQAGYLMWGFIRQLRFRDNKIGLKHSMLRYIVKV